MFLASVRCPAHSCATRLPRIDRFGSSRPGLPSHAAKSDSAQLRTSGPVSSQQMNLGVVLLQALTTLMSRKYAGSSSALVGRFTVRNMAQAPSFSEAHVCLDNPLARMLHMLAYVKGHSLEVSYPFPACHVIVHPLFSGMYVCVLTAIGMSSR
jgi:hypothetical protein